MVKSVRKRPLVGLGLIVLKNDSVLLGKRINIYGHGSWGFPEGDLGHGEDLNYCALRELNEKIGNIRVDLIDKFPIAVTNDYFKEVDKHYFTVYLRALHKQGSPELFSPKEKEKCEKWDWFRWDDLKRNEVRPLFLPIRNLLTQNFNPFEKKPNNEDDFYNIDLTNPKLGDYLNTSLLSENLMRYRKSKSLVY